MLNSQVAYSRVARRAWKWKCESPSHVQFFATPWTVEPIGFSLHGTLQARILEWVALPFSRDLPDPGIKPGSSALQADFLLSEPPGVNSVKISPTSDRFVSSISSGFCQKNSVFSTPCEWRESLTTKQFFLLSLIAWALYSIITFSLMQLKKLKTDLEYIHFQQHETQSNL